MINVIDEYIKNFPQDIQAKLNEIRNIIKEVVPEETIEKISWRMPTFYLNGNLVHFAGHKNHIGFYPGPEVIIEFQDEIEKYENSKGAIQFKYKDELPKELIQKIVKYRVEQNKK